MRVCVGASKASVCVRVCVGASKASTCMCRGEQRVCVCRRRARQACPAGLETQSVHSTLDLLVFEKIILNFDKKFPSIDNIKSVLDIYSKIQRSQNKLSFIAEGSGPPITSKIFIWCHQQPIRTCDKQDMANAAILSYIIIF